MRTPKLLQFFLLVSFLIAAIQGALAGSSAGITLTATLLPDACSVSVNKSRIDFGEIPAKRITEKPKDNHLPENVFRITTSCSAKARSYVKFIDDRAGSEGGDMKEGVDTVFGLGLYKGKTVGGYQLYALPAGNYAYDGILGSLVVSSDGGQSWRIKKAISKPLFIKRGDLFGVGVSDPISAKTTRMSLKLVTSINARSALDFSSTIPIDGRFTIELYTL